LGLPLHLTLCQPDMGKELILAIIVELLDEIEYKLGRLSIALTLGSDDP